MIFTASGTIINRRFVKISGVGTVAQQGTAGAKCIGISQEGGRSAPVPSLQTSPVEAAQSGDQLTVWTGQESGQWPLLEVGTGGVTVGDNLGSDANGKGVTDSTSGHYICAIALQTGSAGEFVAVMPTLFIVP